MSKDQRHGERNALIKKIWIEPVFVNADETFMEQRTAYKLIKGA